MAFDSPEVKSTKEKLAASNDKICSNCGQRRGAHSANGLKCPHTDLKSIYPNGNDKSSRNYRYVPFKSDQTFSE